MTDTIYVKGLNKEIKLRLEKMAKDKGLSLNKYVINILTDYALNPLLSIKEEKYTNILKDVTALYQSLNQTTREVIAENTILLRELKERMDEK